MMERITAGAAPPSISMCMLPWFILILELLHESRLF